MSYAVGIGAVAFVVLLLGIVSFIRGASSWDE